MRTNSSVTQLPPGTAWPFPTVPAGPTAPQPCSGQSKEASVPVTEANATAFIDYVRGAANPAKNNAISEAKRKQIGQRYASLVAGTDFGKFSAILDSRLGRYYESYEWALLVGIRAAFDCRPTAPASKDRVEGHMSEAEAHALAFTNYLQGAADPKTGTFSKAKYDYIEMQYVAHTREVPRCELKEFQDKLDSQLTGEHERAILKAIRAANP